jgi:type IV secretory pathway VirB2 component (pilin)
VRGGRPAAVVAVAGAVAAGLAASAGIASWRRGRRMRPTQRA